MAQGTKERAEVYGFSPWIFWSALLMAFLIQGLIPIRFPFGRVFDLPLIMLIYFSANRSSKVYGIFLGAGIGILQDALSPHGYIGLFGMAKSVVGYLAPTIAVRVNLDQTLPRVVLTGVLVLLHGIILRTLEQTLLENPNPFVPLDFLNGVGVNTSLGIVIFPLLDRVRKRVW